MALAPLAPDDARHFACGLALNPATRCRWRPTRSGTDLAAEGLAPNIGIVIAVSAIAPATLGAVGHLAVLARRAPDAHAGTDADVPADAPARTHTRTHVAPAEQEDGDGYSAERRAEAAELGHHAGAGAARGDLEGAAAAAGADAREAAPRPRGPRAVRRRTAPRIRCRIWWVGTDGHAGWFARPRLRDRWGGVPAGAVAGGHRRGAYVAVVGYGVGGDRGGGGAGVACLSRGTQVLR